MWRILIGIWQIASGPHFAHNLFAAAGRESELSAVALATTALRCAHRFSRSVNPRAAAPNFQ
jgi:hypothetical protein